MEEEVKSNTVTIEPCPKNSKAYFEQDIKVNGARNVRVWFKLQTVEAIDCVNNQAIVDFVLFRQWIDPCMVNAMKDHGFGRTFAEYDELCWNPELEINNDASLEQIWNDDALWNLIDEKTGLMQFSERYRGAISSSMRLERFPFDTNIVDINIGPKWYNMGSMNVMVDEEQQAKFNANVYTKKTVTPKIRVKPVDAGLEEWDVMPDIRTYVYEKAGKGKWNLQNVNHSFEIVRQSSFYIYKIVSVEVILAIWSWVVFFFPPGDLADRYSITLTLFLAAVAFLFVINDQLPRVAYLTVLDKNVLGTFLLLFLTAVESWFTYVCAEIFDNRKVAQYADYASMIVFPLMYIILSVLFFLEAPAVRKYLQNRTWCRSSKYKNREMLEQSSKGK